MPYADKDKQREYQREWMQRRRSEWISENGPCSLCGSEEDLEVDHVDRSTKSMNPSGIWGRSKAAREAELAKCQVLCGDCHMDKTKVELSELNSHELTHGIAGYKKGCRCDVCHDGLLEYWRNRRK